MAESFAFVVPGDPVAQPRHQATARGGKVRHYLPTDHPVRAFKAHVRLAARGVATVLSGPVKLELGITFAPTGQAREVATWRPRKPDSDNVEKAIKDALTGIAYHDDSQVCLTVIRKCEAARGKSPYVAVRVTSLAGTVPAGVKSFPREDV